MRPSSHSRLDISPPEEDFDAERARRLCAEISRLALADFAPGLLLLPGRERGRLRALIAYAFTLFDFARQHGMEGERLAQINRWQFALEEALSGGGLGQPIYVRMAEEDAVAPWCRDALDGLADVARRRAVAPQVPTSEVSFGEARRLASALLRSLFGREMPAELEGWLAALLRLYELRSSRGSLPGHRRVQSEAEPTGESLEERASASALEPLLQRDASAVRSLLSRGPRAFASLPSAYVPAARFATLAGRRLLRRWIGRGLFPPATDAAVGLWSRIALLLRSRWPLREEGIP